MKLVKIVLKNLFRHRLRTILTMLGIATAVMAFGLIRTIVGAWNAGVAAAAANRMITRQSVSFIFPLRCVPPADRPGPRCDGGLVGQLVRRRLRRPQRLQELWPRFAVDAETFYDLYPEYQVPPDQLAQFRKERNACIIGRKLAAQHGFKIVMSSRWRGYLSRPLGMGGAGIYTGRDQTVDETQMFFQWNYLYEQVRAREPGRPVEAGWFILRVEPPDAMPRVATAVDGQFVNSRAPTKTETEKAFQQGFVAMSSAIITSLQVISVVIVGSSCWCSRTRS